MEPKITLYQVISQLGDLESYVDIETGEIDTEKLDALEIAKDEKINAILGQIKNGLATIKAYKDAESDIASRRKSLEAESEHWKTYLEHCLQGEKFKGVNGNISYRKSQSVDITDISEIPKKFLKEVNPVADKIAIKEAIKNGETIQGASLVEKVNMIIK